MSLKNHHQVQWGILLCCLCLSAILSAWAGTATLAAAILPDATSDKVTAATSAADKAIEKAKPSTVKVTEAKEKLAVAAKLQKAEEATWKAFDELKEYLTPNIEKIVKDQKESLAALEAQKAAVKKLREELEALKEKPEGTDAHIATLKTKETDLDTQIKASKDAAGDLEKEAKKLYANVEAMAKPVVAGLAPLGDEKLAAADAKADAILTALSAHLPVLTAAIPTARGLEQNWAPLAAQVQKIADPPATLTDATGKVKAAVEGPQGKLAKWIEILKTQAEATNNALLDKRLEMDKDLQGNAVTALKLLDKAEQEQGLLAQVSAAMPPLLALLKGSVPFPAINTQFETLDKAFKIRQERAQVVRSALEGDFAKFVPDFVQLYYFSDAQSLMRALNPTVKEFRDATALREEATRQRRLLDEATLAQGSAQSTVDELQTRVRDLEDTLRDAERNAAASARDLLLATRRHDELKSRPNPEPHRIKAAEEHKADVETRDKANQDTLNKLTDEKATLPTQLNDARKALFDAQKLVRDRRIAMISLAQVESEAFAKARDSEPIFYTNIEVTSKDPVRQIQIFAFGSRRVLYLRGTRENVDKAKEIIALFDRPAPQARLNLWTLELNSTAGNDGAKKFNKALSRVENELSNTRAKITAALSYLRDCINEEVNAIAIEKLRELEAERLNAGLGPDNNQNYAAPQDAEDLRWARMHFYQKEVLMRLGFDAEKRALASRNQSGAVNFKALPDPAGTTTLGEGLVILSLANAASRHEILKKFSAGVEGKLTEMGLYEERKDDICREERPAPLVWFASTMRSMGADDQPYYKYRRVTEAQLRRGRPDPSAPPAPRFFAHDYAFTSMQQRIVEAVSMAQVPRAIRRLRQLQQRLQLTPGDGNAQDEARAILSWLRFTLGVDVNDVLTPGFVEELEALARKNNVLRTANAKVASTDLMLRQMINEVDSDIRLLFVQPMVDCLRRQLVSEGGISVGIVNYTSVLATNRLVARVDARSSAQLSIGEEQDVLAGVQQLVNLYLSAQTGNILGGISALRSLPQKETSELYGINNGSLFKVTPIFDPTGQALRFQFDYVLANMVRDPDGSINPQLPRIERHTVNTEVELNNLELREISRFNSNSRLGIPTTRKGGIPIVKDIPGMKYVPLLGWFVRRSGKSAIIQQSLMFGQTTMHPTIADIFDLLTGEDYRYAEQDCQCSSEGGTVSPAPTDAEPGGPASPDKPRPATQSPSQSASPSRQQRGATDIMADDIKKLQGKIVELEGEIDKQKKEAEKSAKTRKQADKRVAELMREIAVLETALTKMGVSRPASPSAVNPGLSDEENRPPARTPRPRRRRSQGQQQQQQQP
ncbi:MAG TPA: hypothetical protein VF297_01775 [Pyrinomonadaceae bacterium]